MGIWKEILAEQQMSAAEIRKAGEAALRDEKKKNKEERKKKEKSAYTEYLQQQLEFKKQKYEEQKKKQLENIKKRGTEKHKEGIKSALGGVKTDTISSKDPEGTAYTKAAGNVASLAGGVAKAAVHGVGYLVAKRKAEKEAAAAKERQIEKKEPGKQGRPKGGPQGQPTQQSSSQPTQQSQKPKPSSFRSQLHQAGIIRKGMGEGYSNWREELIIEQGLIIEVDTKKIKTEKKKIDVMRGKNKIKLNPTVSEDHKEIASGKKKDDEGYMANVELDQMERAIKALRKKVKKSDTQLPAWVQSKITKAADYIDTASDYLMSDEELSEAVDKSAMKCNKPKAQAHGSGETGKSHIVKACEGGTEKIIRFGQLGVKGSPKKEGESEAYASRRHRFQSRHAKNIAKGKMSAAYWANKVKW